MVRYRGYLIHQTFDTKVPEKHDIYNKDTRTFVNKIPLPVRLAIHPWPTGTPSLRSFEKSRNKHSP